MQKVLLLGGNGFLGKHILKRLVKLNAEVIIVGRKSLNIKNDDFQSLTIDLTLAHDINKNLPTDFTHVINTSGSIDHSLYFEGGDSIFDAHFLGLKNVINHIDRSCLERFIQIGSSDEYGSNAIHTNESIMAQSFSPYSLGKNFATQFIKYLSDHEDFPGVVLRLFLFYGPGQKLNRFLPSIVDSCLRDQIFPVSPGEQLRDFCYVEDIAEAIIQTMTAKNLDGEIINLGSGQGVSIKEMVMRVQKIIGLGTPDIGALDYRKGENMKLIADMKKANSLLDWRATTSLENGLKKTIAYYQNIE